MLRVLQFTRTLGIRGVADSFQRKTNDYSRSLVLVGAGLGGASGSGAPVGIRVPCRNFDGGRAEADPVATGDAFSEYYRSRSRYPAVVYARSRSKRGKTVGPNQPSGPVRPVVRNRGGGNRATAPRQMACLGPSAVAACAWMKKSSSPPAP